MSASPSLLDLPPELIERILLCCRPRDVARVAATCHSVWSLLYKADDQYIWRELFLARPFDDLRKALPPLVPLQRRTKDWRTELQRREDAETVVRRGISGPRLQRALETLIAVVESALPVDDGPDVEASDNLRWLDNILHTVRFDACAMTFDERQLLGRLMTYHSLSYETTKDDEATRKRLNELRRTSRCYVYDLRRYREATAFGPFLRSDRGGGLTVNWEHMEHVVNVVAMKLRELPLIALRLYSKPRSDLSALQAYSAPFAHDRKPHDWAGVAGTWRRFVCFMDYRDLFAFNFSVTQHGPRDASFFDDDYQEAIRPVELHLDVLDPAEDDEETHGSRHEYVNPQYPPIFFRGFSRNNQSTDAAVEGSVRLLADGGIRWSFVTRYDGLTQWSAEGVQIGNVCSAAGVAGIWTGAFHEDADPAGPFWMWKVPGGLPDGLQI